MSNDRLGVIGGMGPQATNTFYQYIIDRTDARTDQEHLSVLIFFRLRHARPHRGHPGHPGTEGRGL